MPLPRHRPERQFPHAERRIISCELNTCPHCGMPLRSRKLWYTKKYVQTLTGPQFVAGRSKKCNNPECAHTGQHYYASQMLLISLPKSTYGLDVLAFIGWQHEHEHKQLVEIQQELNRRGILINERNVGKLYRQFLALLGAPSEAILRRLEEVVARHGGLIWAIDALQPEGCGTLLYVLYEVLSGTVVGAVQLAHPTSAELCQWLQPYQALPYPVLATLSDGEEAIVDALQTIWPKAPHQRCQSHFLGNLAEAVLDYDTQLRKQLREDLGGLPAIPESNPDRIVSESSVTMTASISAQPGKSSFFLPTATPQRDATMAQIEGQVRSALRDAVNLASRKPMYWGGLAGYQQMEAIGQACHQVVDREGTNIFWQRLTSQVDRAIEKNRTLAEDLQKARQKLKRVAECLHYPPSQHAQKGKNQPTAEQVTQDMDRLIQEFQAETEKGVAQIALYGALKRRWKSYGKDLLHCYNVPGLPPDNLKLDSRFGSLRRHQRRISGRKSTRELRDFGQYQVLFMAENKEALLKQLQKVPYQDYLAHRRRLAEAEIPHQFLRRLHRNPAKTMQGLIDQYLARCTELAQTVPRLAVCGCSI